MLADGTGGNGSTSCDGSFGNAVAEPAVTSFELMLPPSVDADLAPIATVFEHVSGGAQDGEQTAYQAQP